MVLNESLADLYDLVLLVAQLERFCEPDVQKTSGDYDWRIGQYDDIGRLLDEKTRSGAIDGACLFTQQMLPALAKAVEHPDMTEDLAAILSTPTVDIEYRIETGVTVR